MDLSVRKSRQSLMSSHSGKISLGSAGSFGASDHKDGLIITNLMSSFAPEKENFGSLPKLKKAKTSMMAKTNRISLADAINIA